MIITEVRRFIYGLLALTFATITVLVLFNVHALEMFLLLIIIDFLVVVELTEPPLRDVSWRKYITVFVVLAIVIFSIILYQRVVMILGRFM